MTPLLSVAAATLLVAAVTTNLFVPLVVRLATALRALDQPSERKEHVAAMPRLGGLAIVAGLAFGAALGTVVGWDAWVQTVPRAELVALGLGVALVFVVGAVDDLFGVTVGKKFVVQILAAWLVVRVGWSFEVLRLPGFGLIELGVAGHLASIAWIVGVTNAMNLIDGLDGLAAGVAAIIAGSFSIYAMLQGAAGSVVMMAAMTGACLGFLRHNWAPARIFMGDSGSLVLGFLLATLSVKSSLKAHAAVAILVPVLALGVPVFDTLLVMGVRFFSGRGRPLARRFARMFEADRSHLHHLMLELGMRRAMVVRLIFLAVLLGCAGALFVATSGSGDWGWIMVVGSFATVAMVRVFGLGHRAREQAAAERQAGRELLEVEQARSEASAEESLSP